MDPISGIIGIAGLGLDIFGAMKGASAAHEAAGVSRDIAGKQVQENQQRQLAMQVSARRSQMEILRQNQRAQSMATAGATNQGAQFGSGLQGGLAQVEGQSGSNLLGVNQQLTIGNKLFSLEGQIGEDRMQLAGLQGQEATAAGIGALGGALGRNAGTLSNIFQFGAGKVGNLFGGSKFGAASSGAIY